MIEAPTTSIIFMRKNSSLGENLWICMFANCKFLLQVYIFCKSYLYKRLVYFTRELNNDKISINNYNERDV